jgi:RNA polymerase sigma factor (sigma-70 family)
MNRTYQVYIAEIKDQILPPEEEIRLIKIYQSRAPDWEDAQDKVVKSNLMYVVKVAFEYTTDPIKVCDLISEGNMGLLDCLDKFKPELGVKLISYANLEIRSRMFKFIARNNYFAAFKLSTARRDLASKVKRFFDEYEFKNGVKPNRETIQEQFEVDSQQAEMFLEMAEAKIVSVDSPISPDDAKKIDIEDEKAHSPAALVHQQQVSEIISKIISNLPLRERTIINKRFGLNGEQETDLLTIGQQFGLTKERIRQIEFNVLKTIRKEIEKFKISTE